MLSRVEGTGKVECYLGELVPLEAARYWCPLILYLSSYCLGRTSVIVVSIGLSIIVIDDLTKVESDTSTSR